MPVGTTAFSAAVPAVAYRTVASLLRERAAPNAPNTPSTPTVPTSPGESSAFTAGFFLDSPDDSRSVGSAVRRLLFQALALGIPPVPAPPSYWSFPVRVTVTSADADALTRLLDVSAALDAPLEHAAGRLVHAAIGSYGIALPPITAIPTAAVLSFPGTSVAPTSGKATRKRGRPAGKERLHAFLAAGVPEPQSEPVKNTTRRTAPPRDPPSPTEEIDGVVVATAPTGTQLCTARESLGWSQRDAAPNLGFGRSFLSTIEAGRRNRDIAWSTRRSLRDRYLALGVDPAVFAPTAPGDP